ncbi:MAG: UvrD-helicase domain-containing protein, partial [Candidatus Sumerlaeota bacterium]
MVQYTPSQELAIATTGCDLLVSASAGTGKTAVRVERVLRLCLRSSNPVDLDRMLIVTFTEAAASEMRERLQTAFSAAIDRGEGDLRLLRRQLVLLDRAQISTIHSFCATLLRQHFHRLGLDPDFAVQTEERARLLQAEVIEQVFRDYLERGDWRFLEWLEAFSGADPSENAAAEVRSVHRFLVSLPDGAEWMQRTRAAYPLDSKGRGLVRDPRDQAWFQDWKRLHWERVERWAELAAQSLHRARELALDKPVEWIGDAADILQQANEAFRLGHEEEAVHALREYSFGAYPGP